MFKKIIMFVILISLITIPSMAMSWSSSSFSIGIAGGNGYSGGGFYFSSTRVTRRYRPYYGGYRSYYGGYRYRSGYGPPYYPYNRVVHRQAGRRYINDFPCAPVIVVPAGPSTSVYYGY